MIGFYVRNEKIVIIISTISDQDIYESILRILLSLPLGLGGGLMYLVGESC